MKEKKKKKKCWLFSPHEWKERDGSADRFHKLWECIKCGKVESTSVIGNIRNL